jgi:hypothetical protein
LKATPPDSIQNTNELYEKYAKKNIKETKVPVDYAAALDDEQQAVQDDGVQASNNNEHCKAAKDFRS